MLVLALHDLDGAGCDCADVTAAMTVEALLGTDRAFAADLQALRPQVGQAVSARNLRRLLAGSAIVASHRDGDSRVQDAYSLRCTPQVHGAALDTIAHAAPDRRARARRGDRQPDDPARRPRRVLRQLPRRAARLRLRLPRDRRQRAGGDRRASHRPAARPGPLARAAAVPHHRRRRQLRLHDRPLHAGGDGAREQAAGGAGTVDSLPTSAMQEDHVSNGWAAARKLRRAVANLRRVLAVELVCARRGSTCGHR